MVYRFSRNQSRFVGNINSGISVFRYGRLSQTVPDDQKPWVAPIRRLLAAKGWTQGELAIEAKLRPSTLSEALNGRRPRMDTMEKIAAAFGVPLWALFVDERQAALLNKQEEADTDVARVASLADRVATLVMEKFAPAVADAARAVIDEDTQQRKRA